ncbi:hypothetical protein CRT60_03535 [Azospirillum palustre]|uniref:Uncharacterized protein n=1 Tax=Azospirillum palustre TaxID=2044885 RepID=A0A2B8BNE3_9PROT|nr:hypothetical protein [Azospirillum palustre]PGH59063.1 hypothetical protein CRT60_03535 [Azospirillum palustre]
MMASFPLRMPDDLKDEAALASRVDAQAEATRYFAARAARATPGRAKDILSRSGAGNAPRDDDRIE